MVWEPTTETSHLSHSVEYGYTNAVKSDNFDVAKHLETWARRRNNPTICTH